MLDNWEADKARIMQDELGVTDEEVRSVTHGLGQSALSRSHLGGSVRKVSTRLELDREMGWTWLTAVPLGPV
jgi:nuclear pore complex protein Nup93